MEIMHKEDNLTKTNLARTQENDAIQRAERGQEQDAMQRAERGQEQDAAQSAERGQEQDSMQRAECGQEQHATQRADHAQEMCDTLFVESTQDVQRLMSCCTLCPRECGVNRMKGERGYCGMGAEPVVARASLHMWEEPCISGREGSGTVFFSGCSLGCIFCQNIDIARGEAGIPITVERLSEIFLEQQARGANNINLVTACHFVPQTVLALRRAKAEGLRIPVVYNSSGYEKRETLRLLDGLVDIYLPDFKYMDGQLAKKYSKAEDYPSVAREALREMIRQVPEVQFDERGMMTRGVIVRLLLLPGHVKDAKRIVEYLLNTWGNRIYISLMNQYTPLPAVAEDPLLCRRVTPREYERLLDYALFLGLENGFMQDGQVAKESFIPAFDGEGVCKP